MIYTSKKYVYYGKLYLASKSFNVTFVSFLKNLHAVIMHTHKYVWEIKTG